MREQRTQKPLHGDTCCNDSSEHYAAHPPL
jgi:hypothetical protein